MKLTLAIEIKIQEEIKETGKNLQIALLIALTPITLNHLLDNDRATSSYLSVDKP